MNTSPTPAPRRVAMVANRILCSAAVRVAVGSSITITRACRDRARAISTSCCCAMPSCRTRVCGATVSPTRASSSFASRFSAARRIRPSRSRGRWPRKMFSATERSGTRLSSWWMTMMPASSESRGRFGRNGWPPRRISPRSAGNTPARIFISVDLPAPFSPTMPSTSPPSSEMLTSDRARTPGKPLEMSRISSRRVIAPASVPRS